MKKLTRWNRRRRFGKAYKVLEKEARRHSEAGHLMQFEAINQSYILMRCTACPNLTP